MNKEIKVRIILRHNTTSGWSTIGDTEVLYKGEMGLEFISGNNIPKIKFGDGISPWNRLQYFSVDIPEKYTWNDLIGLNLKVEGSITPNLGLKKPGYEEVVNLRDLNNNYDILDNANQDLRNLINAITSRIDNLVISPPEEDGAPSDVNTEVYDMRTRYNGVYYESAGTAMRAIDEDLSKLSAELSNFIGSSIPDGLYYKDNMLWLTSGGETIGDPVEVIGGSGGGGGGSASSFTVTLTNLLDTRVLSVAAGNPVELKFNYKSADAEGYTDGNGIGILTVNSIQQTTFIVPQGDFSINVSQYLKDGSNNVKIQVTNSEGAYRSLSYTVNILTLSITSPSALMNFYNSDTLQSVNFQYTVNGSSIKTVYFLMDGTELKRESVTSTGQNRQFLIPAQSDGAHIFETYATSGEGENLIQSNKIRIGMIWYSSKTNKPIILFNSELKEITQGETISLPYIVFHPDVELASITREILYDKPILDEEGNPTGQTERSVYFSDKPSVGRESLEWTTQDYPAGDNVEFKITCGTESASMIIKVLASTFDREIYTDNLLLEFNANGRENTDPNPSRWNYANIEATFSNNISWSEMDGWLKDKDGQSMLRLFPKSQMYIPFKPFDKEITLTGYTIEIELATQNVNDYDSIITSSFANDRGLMIKSQSARLVSSQSDIEVQFKEDQRIRLTFVVEQGGENASRLIYVYINGILCGVQQYPNTTSFNQKTTEIEPVGLTIGADSCGIDVYFIRFYNIAFTADMQLNNFMVDRSSLAERIEIDQRNNIIDTNATDAHKKVTIESLKGSIPYIVMQCPELPQFKGDKKKGMTMYYVDPKHPEKNFTARGVQFDVQGTSSQYYPVKNFKDSCKEGITYDQSGRYADGFEFTDNSLTSRNLCLKADFASSENANNVCLVDLYNSITPYLMPAQLADERIRQGIYGQPILLFWENTDTKEIRFEGKYNMNDDKSNENVFGFVGVDLSEVMPGITPRIECWEWLNNNTAFCLFQEDSGWDDLISSDDGLIPKWLGSFEPRYPDLDDMYSDTTALKRMVSWVVSTRTDRALSTPLEEEKYYITRDTSWNSNKNYYADSIGTPATIIPKGDVLSYDDDISINKDVFYNKMEASSYEELVGGYTFILDEITNLWSLYRGENTLIASNIDNIGLYGVSLSGTFTSFAFEYRIIGEGWNTSLYECFTHDTADYRLSKFKAEFKEYFELDAMLFYYIFTETFLMIDNRAKNMFLTTFDGIHWFPIPYDMDTALGINNSGQLVFDYNLEDTDYTDGKMTYDGVNKLYDGTNTYTGTLNNGKFITDDGKEINFTGSKVYNAQDSVLWINFRKCFSTEIKNMYQTIRTNEKEFSGQGVIDKMSKYQSAWVEAIWNLDQEIKFLLPFFGSNGDEENKDGLTGKDYLAMAQGDKRSQRGFWTFNTFKYRDSKYQTGDAMQNSILIRLYNKGEINIVPYSHIYTRVRFGNAKDESKRTWRNETATFTTDGIASVNDLETYIYSADRISDLGDLSNFKIGLCDFSSASKLRRIILGRYEDNYNNGNLKSFTLGVSDLLQEIDISNCYNLTQTIEAGRCPCLEVFKARGSAIRGATFSNGGRLRIVHLPETISNLTLRNQTQLEELIIGADGAVNPYNNIDSLNIENTPNVPFEDIIFSSSKLTKVRLYNVQWNTTEERLDKLIDLLNRDGMTNIDGSSNKPTVVGRVNLPALTDETLLSKINDSFPELIVCINGVAKYFINYKDVDNKIVYSYIAEGGTEAIDPVAKGFITEDKITLTPPTEDTRYFYNGWEYLPTNIDRSWTIRVLERREFLVRFYDSIKTEDKPFGEEYTFAAQWVKEGDNASNPYPSLVQPTKEPSAQYSYTYKEWNHTLENVSSPLKIEPVFNEVLNSYIVEFWSNLDEPIFTTEPVRYGEIAVGPELDDVKWYINGDKNKPYNLRECIGWENNGVRVENLLIEPKEYQTAPIRFDALFVSRESINDISWAEIANNAAEGKLNAYEPGNCKDINVVIDGKSYTITMELVDTNFDKLANTSLDYREGSENAAFTFVAKNIGWNKKMNETTNKTFTDPETGLIFTGPTAGGWYNSDLREWTNETLFDALTEELRSVIKKVNKIGDIGMPTTEIENFKERLITSADFIWVPSITELGEFSYGGLTTQQSSQKDESTNTCLSYGWFSENESRIKNKNDTPCSYFTRTHKPGATYRFTGIAEDGSRLTVDGGEGATATTSLGFVFGFCI